MVLVWWRNTRVSKIWAVKSLGKVFLYYAILRLQGISDSSCYWLSEFSWGFWYGLSEVKPDAYIIFYLCTEPCGATQHLYGKKMFIFSISAYQIVLCFSIINKKIKPTEKEIVPISMCVALFFLRYNNFNMVCLRLCLVASCKVFESESFHIWSIKYRLITELIT